jgi:hypothetical protein
MQKWEGVLMSAISRTSSLPSSLSTAIGKDPSTDGVHPTVDWYPTR